MRGVGTETDVGDMASRGKFRPSINWSAKGFELQPYRSLPTTSSVSAQTDHRGFRIPGQVLDDLSVKILTDHWPRMSYSHKIADLILMSFPFYLTLKRAHSLSLHRGFEGGPAVFQCRHL